MGYYIYMLDVRQTDTFKSWISKLRDDRAQSRINVRIRRLSLGNFGDTKSVGSGVWELRIDYGPGYRVYYTMVGKMVIILLAGGDKSTQPRDIKAAIELVKNLED
jgi:putative addiction module killer protein